MHIHKIIEFAGGGAPEIEVSRQLGAWAKTLQGMDSFCIHAFADALEVIFLSCAYDCSLHLISGSCIFSRGFVKCQADSLG